ncbi:Response regulator receiver domain-containing protein [Ruegeria halocynthiae]|uniref:Response regulator receiver domain-containing protein n=1 Tax=Ruegeria halocynthiae TaxID=985054 RepID=A0A1H2WB56_9RHOB|nr:adenylate/guanylate cyclase domain-containing protein [Ruegeria halocynthiae]SDW77767.1 Response regulator receiver domain-containing protein [Ruegeria halocynthiae]
MVELSGNLLIVDDNKVNRLLLSRSVEMLGYRALLAENGRVAVNLLATQDVDLLLLDIEMPEMDGFEVLEVLKSNPEFRDIPVIVTSSVEGLDNIVRCIELGADDYLPKPVNKTLLKARLASCLEKKRLRDEQKRLLERFATSEVAQDLQNSGFAIGGKRAHASVLFCDLRGFTGLSEQLDPEATIELLNTFYTLMFEAVTSNDGIVSLMLGDGLMALFGVPQPLENSSQSAVQAGREMFDMIETLNTERAGEGLDDLRIGVGIATGEVVAGYAGTDNRATYTCIGSTVNLAARLEAETKITGSQFLIDQSTFDLLEEVEVARTYKRTQIKGFAEPRDIHAL